MPVAYSTCAGLYNTYNDLMTATSSLFFTSVYTSLEYYGLNLLLNGVDLY